MYVFLNFEVICKDGVTRNNMSCILPICSPIEYVQHFYIKLKMQTVNMFNVHMHIFRCVYNHPSFPFISMHASQSTVNRSFFTDIHIYVLLIYKMKAMNLMHTSIHKFYCTNLYRNPKYERM